MFSREAARASLIEGKPLYSCLLNAIWRPRGYTLQKEEAPKA